MKSDVYQQTLDQIREIAWQQDQTRQRALKQLPPALQSRTSINISQILIDL